MPNPIRGLVGFRIYARAKSAAKLWYDDYWMVFVMFICFGMSTCDFIGLVFGSGKHQSDLPIDSLLSFMKNLYAYMVLWALGVFSVKVGILLFYWRVFPTRTVRIAVIGVSCLSSGIFFGNFFSFILQCLPIARFWDETVEGTCIDQNSFYLASAVINVCGDVAVLALPIPVVWNLHTSRNKKWSLSFLFLLGAFVCVASIFRIIAVKEIDPSDFTFSNVAGGLWSTVEVEIGFICANLPAIRPLLSRWFGSGNGSSGGSGSGYVSGYGGTGSAVAYGMHSKITASRTGRMPLGSKNGDRDIELMSQGNSSDEINLTKGGHPGSMHSSGSHSDGNTRLPMHMTTENQGSGNGMGSGIRVKTEVQMTVDEWPNKNKTRGDEFSLPV